MNLDAFILITNIGLELISTLFIITYVFSSWLNLKDQRKKISKTQRETVTLNIFEVLFASCTSEYALHIPHKKLLYAHAV